MRRAVICLIVLLVVACGGSPAQATAYVFRYDPPSMPNVYNGVRVGDVVVVGQEDDGTAVQRIHSLGGKAVRYVQYYWTPNTREYQGAVQWEPFCVGGRPQVDTAIHGNPWTVVDLNERSQRNAANRYLRSLKAAGYDGVFFDMGGMSMLGPLANAVSDCTTDPVVRGRTLAQAAVAEYAQAQAIGLTVAFNGGPMQSWLATQAGQWAASLHPTFVMDEAAYTQGRLLPNHWLSVAYKIHVVVLVRDGSLAAINAIKANGQSPVVGTHTQGG